MTQLQITAVGGKGRKEKRGGKEEMQTKHREFTAAPRRWLAPTPVTLAGSCLRPSPPADKCYVPRESTSCCFCRPSRLCAPRGPRGRPLKHFRDKEHSPPRRRFNLSLGKVVVGARPRCIFKHCPFLEIRVPQNNGPLHPQARCCLLGNGARTTVPETIG